MKTSFFKEFLILAELLSFSKAAKKIGINQSALSRHIKQLEDELGVPLFTRTTQKIELTPYGIAFLPHAVSILNNIEEFFHASEAISRDAANCISLGVCGYPSYYGITALFSDFKNKYPEAIIDVRIESADDSILGLQAGLLDAAFIHNAGGFERDYHSIPFCEDYISVSLPAKHPLSSKKALKLTELRNETFYIRHKKDSYMHNLELNALRNAGFEPKISPDKGTWEDSVINRSNEISLVMQGLAKGLSNNAHIHIVDIEPRIHTDIHLIYPRERKLSQIVKTFIEFVSENTLIPAGNC